MTSSSQTIITLFFFTKLNPHLLLEKDFSPVQTLTKPYPFN